MYYIEKQYDTFAPDYHWLFSDTTLTGEPFVEQHQSLLDSLPSDGTVLDCACGPGNQALALARHGYRVHGSDVSAGMIAAARRNAADAGLGVPFTRSAWADLPQRMRQRFDLAFCGGNAIGHCRDGEEMVASLRGIRGVLKPRGRLALRSRNWEKLCAERPHVQKLGMRSRRGQRCMPMYLWNLPKRWQDPLVVDVGLLFEREGQLDVRHYPVTYYPFRVSELLDRLLAAGFDDIETDYNPLAGTYTVTAVRSDP